MAEKEIAALPESAPPAQKRIIEWRDGAPVLSAIPVLTPQHVRSLYWIAAAQPYEVTDPLDPDFGLYDGLTIAEVMVRKQLLAAARTGNVEVAMDRLIGKPLAKSESLNVNVSGNYEEWLKAKAEKLRAEAVEAEVVRTDDGEFGDLA